MPTAEARIVTDRPSRYLVQLCQHVNSIYSKGGLVSHRRRRRLVAGGTQERPDVPPRVEWSETQGSISFDAGNITMQASPGALILRAESADEESLPRSARIAQGAGRAGALGSPAWRNFPVRASI
jgi:hypothetical protein